MFGGVGAGYTMLMDNASSSEGAATVRGQGTDPAFKKQLIKVCAAIAVSLLFFSLVPPTSIPLVMLVVGFIMLGMLLYGIFKLILLVTGLQERLKPLQRRSILLLGVCLPLLLIMLQSLGQLTMRDTLTLSGLFIVGVFYVLHLGRVSRKP